MQHVLVTGGAGYIGSTLVPTFLRAGHRVTVLDRFYFGRDSLAAARAEAGDRLRLLAGDVRTVPQEVFEGVDVVVDLAGISNDPACELDPELTTAVNLEGAVRVASLAHYAGVPRLVFSSSCSIYGAGATTALTEESPKAPVSLYARCKAEAERELLQLGAQSDLCVTALRLATVFGLSPRMRFDLAVNVMTKNAYVDGHIRVNGGAQWRPFVHVSDVARAFLHVVQQPEGRVRGRVFNVGSSDQNFQMRTLAYRVRDRVPGAQVEVVQTDPDVRNYNVCFDRIREELDWKTQVGVDQGIDEVRDALAEGRLDPEDRRWYTLRQYRFLDEVERTHRELAIEGTLLTVPRPGGPRDAEGNAS